MCLNAYRLSGGRACSVVRPDAPRALGGLARATSIGARDRSGFATLSASAGFAVSLGSRPTGRGQWAIAALQAFSDLGINDKRPPATQPLGKGPPCTRGSRRQQ